MSYDVSLLDPVTGEVIQLDEKHHMTQGTFQVGGTPEASLNITYNYSKYFYQYIDKEGGLRSLYGKTGATTLPLLDKAIAELSDDADEDYWAACEGNAKKALCNLRALAQMHPEGIWDGD